MLIGLDMDTQYHDGQVQLASGDVLMYYTDGFTDAANRSGERFDEEGLIRHFRIACANGYDSTTYSTKYSSLLVLAAAMKMI